MVSLSPRVHWAAVTIALALLAAPRAAQGQRKSPFEPVYVKPEPTAWWWQEHRRPLPRWWVAPTYARFPAEGIGLGGFTVGAGLVVQPRTPPTMVRWLLGSAFGIEGRVQLFRPLDGAPRPWLATAGVALTFSVANSGWRAIDRVRFPSLFGLLMPEAGVAARAPQPTSLYLRWSVPVAVLVTNEFAVEAVPSAMLLNRGAAGGVEALWLLAVGVSWRDSGQPRRLQPH